MSWDDFGRRRSTLMSELEGVFKVRHLVSKTLIDAPY